MTLWTLTVVEGREVHTTVHPTREGAINCFANNYDPKGEFPRTPSGVMAAADSQGLRIDITERAL